MPTFYPEIEIAKKSHQPLTEGELYLINFFISSLDKNTEVYIQPLINGDQPDIVLVKKRVGIIIIEVKDWKLEYFKIEGTTWRLKSNNVELKSPFNQVSEYRDNFIKLHIEKLFESFLKNKASTNFIKCLVYFHNANLKELNNFIDLEKNHEIDTVTRDNLQSFDFKSILNQSPNSAFDDELYGKFRRYLQPPFHRIEEGIEIKYTPQQNDLIRSEISQRQKVKGLAGCGKTMVLAKRAVNAHIRTSSTVLILTYNLSLMNYIHDRINDVRENFYWNYFYITNYHQFFKTQANNFGLPINSLEPFSDTNFFEIVKDDIISYKTVLIDEVQDYQTSWLEIITKYFTDYETELIVFGDEKQNIYNRPLDESKRPKIKTIPGRWNESLNTSKRFTSNIGKIALKFQKVFFNTKYSIDEIQTLENPELDLYPQKIEYYYFNSKPIPSDFIKYYIEIIEQIDAHPEDIGILSAKVDYLRELDKCIRNVMHEKTETTFETAEYYTKLKEEKNKNKRVKIIEDIRRNKKIHFYFKNGLSKLSTIHSFKGWEILTLFLIIEDNDYTTSEIIYTGFTRARINLIVVNFGNKIYHDFFANNIKSVHILS